MALRLHVENLSSKPPVYRISRQHVDDVLAAHPDLTARLDVSYSSDLADIDRWLPEVEVLVTAFDTPLLPGFPRHDLTKRAPKLRWIHVTSAGVEKLLPLDWLPESIMLTNSSGVHSRKSGEYALMSILMLHNRLPQMLAHQRRAQWKQIHRSTVAGSTITVVGLGGLGGPAAQQARYLGMEVIGVRRKSTPHPYVDQLYTFERLHEALAQADIVYVTVPLTVDTHNLIDRAAFDAMKPGAGLVNVSRGGTVDQNELAARLKDGRLSGAVLDVFVPEPLPADSPLWSLDNLVITPHVGMDDSAAYIPLSLEQVFANLRRRFDGEPLENVVDAKLGY